MDVTQFRLDFPEFADVSVYTNSMCTFWSTLGEQINSLEVFGSAYTALIELFTAHNLSIQATNISASSVGGIPTGNGGAISSKTVEQVSVDYDAASTAISGGGDFNSTSYGRQYLILRRQFTAGVMQV